MARTLPTGTVTMCSALLARENRLEDAVVCLSAEVAEGDRRRATGPALYGRRRQKILGRAEQDLGAAGVADAWRRGGAMTLDAATMWATQLHGLTSRSV